MNRTVHIPKHIKTKIEHIIKRERPASLLRIMRKDPLIIRANVFGDYFLDQKSYEGRIVIPMPQFLIWSEEEGLEKLTQLDSCCEGYFHILITGKKTKRIRNILHLLFPQTRFNNITVTHGSQGRN